MRKVLAIAGSVLAAAALAAAPSAALAQSPRPAAALTAKAPPPPVPSMNTINRNGTILRQGPGGKATAGNMYWAGYAVTAAAGKTIKKVGATFNIPAVNCSKSTIGTSGYSINDYWVGIDGYGTPDLSQTGIEEYCTGPVGGKGTNGPYITAWYDTCCNGQLTFYPNQPALHTGDTVLFSVTFTPGAAKPIEYAYIDRSDASHEITEFVGCPTGETCGNGTAEVITEAPGGGPPSWLLDESDNPMASYNTIFVDGTDGTVGTLDTKSGEWTSSGPLYMAFPSQPYPYIITGNSAAGVSGKGRPGNLNSTGTGFNVGCSWWTSPTADTACINI